MSRDPRFTAEADSQWAAAITAANTAKDMASGTVNLIYTAPTGGALVTGVLAMPLGTNVASVARLFLNNGGATTTPANNILIGQLSLPATTNTETGALPALIIPVPKGFQDIAATHRLYVLLGTAVAAGWQFGAMASAWEV